MKNALLFIGTELKTNEAIFEYILNNHKNHLGELGDIFFSSKTDKNLPLFIENLSNEYTAISIYCHKESFTLASKIISTHISDSLVLKDDMLIPSKTTIYKKNSYLLTLNKSAINVLYVSENQKLPQLLHTKDTKEYFFNLFGMDEQSYDVLIGPIKEKLEISTTITTLVDGWIRLKATSKQEQNLNLFKEEIDTLFVKKSFLAKDPIKYVIKKLKKNNKTISLAESCTGGLLASMFTKIPGSSSVFSGSLVTYSNEIKSLWLGVDKEALDRYSPVSEEVVTQMLDGILKASKADYTIVISGIAGPDGGSPSKPIGTVFVGAARADGGFLIERLSLKGDRNYIQTQSSYSALRLFFELSPELFFD